MEYGNLHIIKLKVLAGPDRLLRIGVFFDNPYSFSDDLLINSFYGFETIVDSILKNHHGYGFSIDTKQLQQIFSLDSKLFIGKIKAEFLFRKNKGIEVKLSYYSEELELARKFSIINSFYIQNPDIDSEKYPRDFSLNNFRCGIRQNVINIPLDKFKIE